MQAKPLKDLVVGAAVGVVSMLPGASGATIAVVFGIYERLVADLASIRHKLLHDLKFVIPVGVGIVIGLFACAFGLDALMDRWEVPMMFLFAALILTQIPDVRAMGDDGKPMTGLNWLALACGILVMIGVLALGLLVETEESDLDNAAVWLLVGVILVVSKLAPGVSGSTILLAMGLYTPFMSAMTEFDMGVLIPGLIGMVVGALVFAKIVDHFLANNRKSTYSAILGLTVGSVIAVTVEALTMLETWTDVWQSAVGIVIGLAFGVLLSRVSKKYARETMEGQPTGAGPGE